MLTSKTLATILDLPHKGPTCHGRPCYVAAIMSIFTLIHEMFVKYE